MLFPDAFSSGYIGGEGTELIQLNDIKDGEIDWNDYDHMRGANQLKNKSGNSRADVFCFLVRKEGEKTQNPIDMRGYFQQTDFPDIPSLNQNNNEYLFDEKAIEHYREKCNFKNKLPDNNLYNANLLLEIPTLVNTICWEGASRHHKKGDDDTLTSTELDRNKDVRNSGHWGHTYPGCKSVRTGHFQLLRPENVDTVNTFKK